MALSPAHRFGQIVGEVLEMATLPLLETFARKYGLYLDRKGRRACRKGRKCTWVDLNGNAHDLDYVLERGGTPDQHGTPVAFIETAWRRYTKHSRNKVQEIQGALQPLVETYRNVRPFTGAILAGVFTSGALAQLRSLGFTVLHIPYETVIQVFRRFGIDAGCDEATADAEFRRKVRAFQRLGARQQTEVAAALLTACQAEVDQFLASLTAAVSRQIESIGVMALHGCWFDARTLADALAYVQGYAETATNAPLQRYEIQIRYTNGDRIDARFRRKEDAVEYLRGVQVMATGGI